MKPTIKQFEEFVNEQEDLDVKWYGEYNGRGSHKGIAVRTEYLCDAADLVGRMAENKFPLGTWQHQDSLGMGQVVSWGVKQFANEEPVDEGMKITCDRALGDAEMESLIAEAKMMDVLDKNKTWVGDGMLYRTTRKDKFHFVDQKYVEDK